MKRTCNLSPIGALKKIKRQLTAWMLVAFMVVPQAGFAANHREAPITALDRLADITDFFAFVSYDHPDKVTLILNVDPLLDPSNGPNYFPFDPDILYEIKIDNNNDAIEDVTFQFRFQTEIRLAPGSGIPQSVAEGFYATPVGITGAVLRRPMDPLVFRPERPSSPVRSAPWMDLARKGPPSARPTR